MTATITKPIFSSLAALVMALAMSSQLPAQFPDRHVDLATLSTDSGSLLRAHGYTSTGASGVPVAGGVDLDGDGFQDTAFAAMRASPFGRNEAGEIYAVFGDGTLSGALDTAVPQKRVLRIAGSASHENAGSELWMEDVTGDGLGDLLICRQNLTPSGRTGAGGLTVLVGGSWMREHANTLQLLDLDSPPAAAVITTVLGSAIRERLGIWARTGDVTGDGLADILVGADQYGTSHSGAAYLIRGGPHLAGGGVLDLADFGNGGLPAAFAGTVARILPPADSDEFHFGATVQIADLDGNGRAEVLVAAALNRAGAALAPLGDTFAHASGGSAKGTLYIGWDEAFEGNWEEGFTRTINEPPTLATVIVGGISNRSFSEEILGGLDYDSNGTADLFVGDIVGNGPNGPNSGLGYVFFDAADLRGKLFSVDNPPEGVVMSTIYGPGAGTISSDTAAHGDFDGDEIADLAIASPHHHPLGRISAGTVHILSGKAGGWPAIIDLAVGALPPTALLSITEIDGAKGTSGSSRGDTLAYSAAAGDLDGDGCMDLIINEMLGNGVAPSAVDVGNLIVVGGEALGCMPPPGGGEPCVAGAHTLCLNEDRFRVEVDWRDFALREGPGRTVPFGSNDSGLFEFFHVGNWEMLIKVLDGCTINNHFWVFFAAATNVEFTVTVTDTESGDVRTYFNPLGRVAEAVTETAAFATCP